MAVGPDLSKLTISQLHELTGRDRRWIKDRLAQRGIEAVDQDGRSKRYASRAALLALFDAGPDSATEMGRLNRARADLAELDLRQRHGEVIPLAPIVDALQAIVAEVRARILAVGPRVSTQLAGTSEPKQINAILEGELHRALRELSQAEAQVVPDSASSPRAAAAGGGARRSRSAR